METADITVSERKSGAVSAQVLNTLPVLMFSASLLFAAMGYAPPAEAQSFSTGYVVGASGNLRQKRTLKKCRAAVNNLIMALEYNDYLYSIDMGEYYIAYYPIKQLARTAKEACN